MSFWHNKRVFITGGNGFLGNRLIESLLCQGAHVTAVLRAPLKDKSLFIESFKNKVNIQVGCLQELEGIARLLSDNKIETVFHLAAQAIVQSANSDPVSTFETNIQGTWNVLEACRQYKGLESVVIASSDKVYGEHATLPYREDFPHLARYPYDVSKSCAEQISLTYYHMYQLPVAIARCSNIFGPGDMNFSRIVPGTIRSALLEQAPIIRSDGSPMRDFVYVQDVVAGFLELSEQMARVEVCGQAYNLGSGEPLSVLELTQLILGKLGKHYLQPEVLDQVEGEVKHHYSCIDRAKQVLGWKPRASIADRIAETIQWYEHHLHPVGH